MMILISLVFVDCKTTIYVSFQSGSKVRTVHRQIGIGNRMLNKDSLMFLRDTIIKKDSASIIK